ncbi:unnamed protein product [Discosporangium mesarthrocarpum]
MHPLQATHSTEFKVGMTCEGCASATKRILSRMDGVTAVEANVETKKVTVASDGSTSPQAMLEALLKWAAASGKSVELIS